MRDTTLSRQELRRLAARWHDAEAEGETWYLRPGAVAPACTRGCEQFERAITGSATGAVLFRAEGEAHLVLPPFPVESPLHVGGWDTRPLVDLVDRERRVAVLLLRLGSYAVGTYHGERLVSHKTESRLVKGRHRKGGSSSARFARRREEQARALFEAACALLERHVAALAQPLEHLVLDGERQTLLSFEKACPYVGRLEERRLNRRLGVREPSFRALQQVPRLLYRSRLLEFVSPGRG